MIKKQVVTLIAGICLNAGFADSIDSSQVGPGVTLYREYRENGPWHMQVLKIDFSNEWLCLETVKAGNLLQGYERTSSMAERMDFEAHRVVGAVNGDFYASGGVPIGAQVLNGMILKQPTTRSVLGYSRTKNLYIDIVSFRGTVISESRSEWTISGVNEARDTDDLIVYNPLFGSSTQTNYWGTEITALFIDNPLSVNEPFRVIVTAKDSIMDSGHGNNTIPSGCLVISGHGTASTFLNENVFLGDTLTIEMSLPPTTGQISELIGGIPRLIRDGVSTVEWAAEGAGQSFAVDRHPRTAVGFDVDSSKVFFFTVDGRQPGYSAGMSLYEMADYMLEWDVYQGVNLDGGGSTTMVVRGEVVNRPSDTGGERSVANALLVISQAPTGEVVKLEITPEDVYVLANSELQFNVRGLDEFFNPVTMEADSVIWTCDESIGSIGSRGLFTAGSDTVYGYVRASYHDVYDSAEVYITDVASIDLVPDPIILEVGEYETVTAMAYDNRENGLNITPSEYTWSVTGDVGTISEEGVFLATREGNGTVFAEYGVVAGSTSVHVGVSTDIILDNFSEGFGWTLSGVVVNIAESGLVIDESHWVSPPSSMRMDYSLSTGGTSALYMNGSVAVSGTPDEIGLQVFGDGHGHWLRGEIEDTDGEKFLLNFTESSPGIDWNQSWQYLKVSLAEAVPHWSNPSAQMTFPVTISKIYMAETDDSNKNSGAIYFDDLTAHYTEVGISPDGNGHVSAGFHLAGMYPNPFNSSATFLFRVNQPGTLSITFYNLKGKRVDQIRTSTVASGSNSIQWSPSHLFASGVYFYQARFGNESISGKCLFLK